MGKSSKSTTTNTTYGETTTSNPYVKATTNNSGTNSYFQPGTAFDTIYNLVNKNIGTMLDDYLNPNLNSVANQAKLNAYNNALESSTYRNLENNIINPLSKRNMLRSSQATDLYKNLSNQNNASLEEYIADLLGSAQDESAKVINNLLQMYLNGYDVLSGTQAQSLQTSAGNATKTSTTDGGSNQSLARIAQLAAQIAKAI